MKAIDWISVEHKLPKRGERVLVCRKLRDGSLFVEIATLERETGRWWDDYGIWKMLPIGRRLFYLNNK